MNEVTIGFGKLKEHLVPDEKNSSGFSWSIAQRGYLLCDDFHRFITFNGSAEAAEFLLKLCRSFPDVEDEATKKENYDKAVTLLEGITEAVRIELLEPSDYFVSKNTAQAKEAIPAVPDALPF